jgi:hypothetical protein
MYHNQWYTKPSVPYDFPLQIGHTLPGLNGRYCTIQDVSKMATLIVSRM